MKVALSDGPHQQNVHAEVVLPVDRQRRNDRRNVELPLVQVVPDSLHLKLAVSGDGHVGQIQLQSRPVGDVQPLEEHGIHLGGSSAIAVIPRGHIGLDPLDHVDDALLQIGVIPRANT